MDNFYITGTRRDKHRGTCLTEIFPEWEPYYEKL